MKNVIPKVQSYITIKYLINTPTQIRSLFSPRPPPSHQTTMATPLISSSSSTPSLMAPPLRPSSALIASSNSLFFTSGAARPTAALVSRRRLRWRQDRPSSGALGARCLFGLGVPELVVIGGVAALLFGPKQLPQIGKTFGKTIKSFQQAAKEFETELKVNPEKSEESPPAEDSTSTENVKKELEVSNK